jgi:hypothetical protein
VWRSEVEEWVVVEWELSVKGDSGRIIDELRAAIEVGVGVRIVCEWYLEWEGKHILRILRVKSRWYKWVIADS